MYVCLKLDSLRGSWNMVPLSRIWVQNAVARERLALGKKRTLNFIQKKKKLSKSVPFCVASDRLWKTSVSEFIIIIFYKKSLLRERSEVFSGSGMFFYSFQIFACYEIKISSFSAFLNNTLLRAIYDSNTFFNWFFYKTFYILL